MSMTAPSISCKDEEQIEDRCHSIRRELVVQLANAAVGAFSSAPDNNRMKWLESRRERVEGATM